ncbi:MAG TPA: alpha-ketoglutarate-dependent dioxygenase AlkB [Acidimicrobiia bacterium]|nr:alpha-ketoglutarate-dependent dioxygenase AlkB [Acidimicrobiia bacterium]
MNARLTWQPSLLDAGPDPAVDETFAGATRTWLDKRSWIERVPGWVSNSDALFAHLVETADWGQRTRKMWENEVLEPRLTSWWGAETGRPLEPILERMRRTLSERYGVEFDSMGLNLYRDGRDSVAWHGDRIAREIVEPVVAIVSIGEPRKFLLRPKAKGTGLPTHRLLLGRGELLVTGGTTQRAWEHSVPKVASAGPRMSLTFRHGLLPIPGRSVKDSLQLPSGTLPP